MISFHPPGYDPFARSGPDVDLSETSARYPRLPLEATDGIEIRPYAGGYPGQRIGVGPYAVRYFRVQRLAGGIPVQSANGYTNLSAAEQAADMMAAGAHARCCECKGPCYPTDRFDPADERPTCAACCEWIRTHA